METNRDKLIAALRKRIDEISLSGEVLGEKIIDKQVAVLLGELEITQVEIEMQNDELLLSSQILETERAKFAGFFNLAPIGYFILNQVCQVIEVNQVGLSLLEVENGKIINQRFQSFVAPEHWERFYVFLHKMQLKKTKQRIELKILLSTGRSFFARMEGLAINNLISKEIEYYITVNDITESRKSQQELNNTTQRLELTLKASGMGTWTIDLRENRMFLDNYGLSMLEIHPWDFDGSIKKFISSIHPDDQQYVKHQFLNNFNQLQKIDIEFRILGADGKIKYLVAQGQLVEVQSPKLFFAGIIIDVTEQKKRARIEAELLKEKQKLVINTTIEAQEKERQKISSILHDSICQLLYGIRLNLQNIQAEHKLTNDFKNVHDLIAVAIKETRELSYELTPSILRDFGLHAGLLDMVKRLSLPGFVIIPKINTNVDKISMDLQLTIFRIIQELLNNCIKHAKASKAEVVVSLTKQYIKIVVSDNGIGFENGLESSLLNGSGLRGIKNRIFLMNGNLDVKTNAHGTQIAVKFETK